MPRNVPAPSSSDAVGVDALANKLQSLAISDSSSGVASVRDGVKSPPPPDFVDGAIDQTILANLVEFERGYLKKLQVDNPGALLSPAYLPSRSVPTSKVLFVFLGPSSSRWGQQDKSRLWPYRAQSLDWLSTLLKSKVRKHYSFYLQSYSINNVGLNIKTFHLQC